MAQNMDERRGAIERMINEEGNVSFVQLKEAFPDVSEMTLRTDLRYLDDQHLIVRVHGGAKSLGFAVGTDGLMASRRTRRVDQKDRIAREAAKLVRPDTTIYLDSGSTTTDLASCLDDMRMIVFTNSISVVSALARLEKARVHVIGGTFNRYSLDMVGGTAMEMVGKLSFDQFFLGVTTYNDNFGFCCGSDDEAAFKRLLVRNSGETIVLMDSSKVGRTSTFSICSLDAVSTVVTDEGISPAFENRCHAEGVNLVKAG